MAQWAFQSQALTQWKVPALKLDSLPGESQAAFRARATQLAREARDREAEKLKAKFSPKFQTLRDQERRAQDRVEKEQEQLSSARTDSWISMGTSLLGSLLGRKKVSATNARRVGSALNKAGKVSREKADIERAKDELEATRQKLAVLEKDFQAAIRELELQGSPSDLHWLPYLESTAPGSRPTRA